MGVIQDLASYDLTERADALVERMATSTDQALAAFTAAYTAGMPVGAVVDALCDMLTALADVREEYERDLAAWRRGKPRPIGFTGYMGGASQ